MPTIRGVGLPQGRIPHQMAGDKVFPMAVEGPLRIPAPPPPVAAPVPMKHDCAQQLCTVDGKKEGGEEEGTQVYSSVDRHLKDVNLLAVVHGVVGIDEGDELSGRHFAALMAQHSNPPRSPAKEEPINLGDSLDRQVGEIALEEGETVDLERKLKVQPRRLSVADMARATCPFLMMVVAMLGGLVAHKYLVVHSSAIKTAEAATSATPVTNNGPTLWMPPAGIIPGEEPPPRMKRLKIDGLLEIPPFRTGVDRPAKPAKKSKFHVDMNF